MQTIYYKVTDTFYLALTDLDTVIGSIILAGLGDTGSKMNTAQSTTFPFVEGAY